MTTTDPPEDLTALRRQRHNQIRDGVGYPDRFERTHQSQQIKDEFGSLGPEQITDERATVAGRLMLSRSFGKLQFGTLRDGYGEIQLFVDSGFAGEELADRFQDLDLGDWIGASGVIMTTKRGELSIRVDHLLVLQKALRPLPEKWHGLKDIETRSRRRYLDLMVNDSAREVARARSSVISELRNQFKSRGFVEVDTPVLTNQASGAEARPFITRHNAHDIEMYLRVEIELYLKRLVVGGMERVFEIGRIFRNEGVDSTHNPEFTMLEAYQAFANVDDFMELVEEVFAAVALAVNGQTNVTFRDRPLDFTGPYRVADYLDLVSEKAGTPVDMTMGYEQMEKILNDLKIELPADRSLVAGIEAIYEELVEPDIWEPTFVLHPPVEISPLARRNQKNPGLADRFELVIAGAEYVNAFSELNDPDDQRSRFERQAAAIADNEGGAGSIDEDYLMALEYGLPPTAGMGIGVDRLVMLLTDMHHIREVILFPTMRPE